MTHENISHPDFYEHDSRPLIQAKLEAELAFYRQRCDAAIDDLRSICDRVQKGERVYFVMRNGDKVEMVLRQEQNGTET